MSLDQESRERLLDTACEAIASKLEGTGSMPPDLDGQPKVLRDPGACFVTLRIRDQLRGCCGSLEARRPLLLDTWHNAQASAFHDPRFWPLRAEEWPLTDVEISVLSEKMPVPASSEAELLGLLRPGRDGLVIALGDQRATFLPSVWEQVAGPDEFIGRLKQKAGWPADFWHPEMRAWVYETESFERPANARVERGLQ
jgi:uncharacterized protein